MSINQELYNIIVSWLNENYPHFRCECYNEDNSHLTKIVEHIFVIDITHYMTLKCYDDVSILISYMHGLQISLSYCDPKYFEVLKLSVDNIIKQVSQKYRKT